MADMEKVYDDLIVINLYACTKLKTCNHFLDFSINKQVYFAQKKFKKLVRQKLKLHSKVTLDTS